MILRKRINQGYFLADDIKTLKEKVFNDSILKTLGHKVSEIISIKQIFADVYSVVYITASKY